MTVALHTDCASVEIQQPVFLSVCHQSQTLLGDLVHLPKNFHSLYSADVISGLKNKNKYTWQYFKRTEKWMSENIASPSSAGRVTE